MVNCYWLSGDGAEAECLLAFRHCISAVPDFSRREGQEEAEDGQVWLLQVLFAMS